VPAFHLVVSLHHGSLVASDPLALEQAATLLGLRGPEGRGWLRRQEAASARLLVEVDPWRTRLSLSGVRGAEDEAIALLGELLTVQDIDGRAWARQRAEAVEQARTAWLAPARVHLAALAQARYPTEHPFSRSPSARALARLRPGRLAQAWREALQARADLVAVGDLDVDALLARLGPMLTGSSAPPPPTLPAPLPGPKVVLVDQPGDARALLSLSLPLPAGVRLEHPAIELLLRALVTDFDGRLTRLLREERGLVYALDGSVRSFSDHAWFELRTSTEGAQAGELLRLLRASLEELALRPPSGEERSPVQAGLRRDLARLLLSNQALAAHLVERQALGLDAARVWDDARAALQADDQALAAAAALVEPERAIWVLSGDSALLDPAFAEAGLAVDRVETGWSLLPP